MEVIHIRIPLDIRKQLRVLAAEREMSMTQLMGEILAEYFGKIKRVNT